MKPVFLSIGSNIRPKKNIPACLKLLKRTFRVRKISSIYETKPVGPAGDKNFWNLVVEIETGLERKALTSTLRTLEKKLGRQRNRKNRFAPRTIDLDILPQPDYQKYAFIMVPLAEVAPKKRDPESGKTFQSLAKPLLEGAQAFKKINVSEVVP